MKIGKLTLETAIPADLEQKVHGLLSASIAEIRSMLDGHCIAGTIAKALHPFLVEAEDLAVLARRIAAEGVDDVKAEVAKLYDDALARRSQPAAASGEDVTDGDTQAQA